MATCWTLAIDWDAVTGILQALAAIAVAACGWKGLNAWRDQMRSKRRQEIAEQALSLAYQISDAIDHMRGPFAWASEMDRVERYQDESDEAYKARRHLGVVEVRYQEHSAAFAQFLAARYQVAVVMGKGAKRAMEELVDLSNKVRRAPTHLRSAEEALRSTILLIEAKRQEARLVPEDDSLQERFRAEMGELEARLEMHEKLAERFNAVLYKGWNTDDETEKARADVLARIEKHLMGSAQLIGR